MLDKVLMYKIKYKTRLIRIVVMSECQTADLEINIKVFQMFTFMSIAQELQQPVSKVQNFKI